MPDLRKTCKNTIQTLLKNFPCIAILGARQVGKTTILKQTLPNAPFFDLEKANDFERIQSDPDFFLSQYQDTPIAIDEAQTLPKLFPALRVAIDSKRSLNGQYLISASSSPELITQIRETLAERIAVFELNGFTIEEAFGLSTNKFVKVHLAA